MGDRLYAVDISRPGEHWTATGGVWREVLSTECSAKVGLCGLRGGDSLGGDMLRTRERDCFKAIAKAKRWKRKEKKAAKKRVMLAQQPARGA